MLEKFKLFLLKFKKVFTINKIKFAIIILIGIPLIFFGVKFLVNYSMEKQSMTKIKDMAIGESVDTSIEDITTLLMNFELPEEGQIKDEAKRDEMLPLHISKEYFIVYENGYIINKNIKTVDNTDYSAELQETQSLAYFKALALFELPGYFIKGSSGSYKDTIYIINDKRDPMEEVKKNYDSNKDSRHPIVMDIDRKINRIERVEEELIDYPVLYEWLRIAKAHLVKAEELGIENWEEFHVEYIKAANMFDELHKSLHESYDYYQQPPNEES